MPSSISSSERPVTAARASGLTVLARGFVLTLLLLVLATEVLVRTLVLPQDTRAGHLTLLGTATQVDAAFGDSHVARGFAAQGDFVNLAYPSENIEDMFAKIRIHYATRAPGRVVLQADPHLFAAYRVLAPQQPLHTPQTPLLTLSTERHRPQLNAYWQAFAEGYGTLASKVRQTPEGALLSDGNFASLAPRAQKLEARERLGYHALARPDAVAAAQARYEEMVAYLAAKGAEICLVSFPVTDAYLAASAQADGAGHPAAIAYFQRTAYAHGARYVDARAQVADDDQFRDADHLNAQGARAFYGALLDQCFAR